MKSIFISHASEDKKDIARPIAEAMKELYNVWYDEYQLVAGMSLLKEINRGLASSDYGIVILSRAFFDKQWPQAELSALFSLEIEHKTIILPIWKNLTSKDILEYSPILADRKAIRSEIGISGIIEEINRTIDYFERGRTIESQSNVSKLRDAISKQKEQRRSDGLLLGPKRVNQVNQEGASIISQLAERLDSIISDAKDLDIAVNGPKISNGYCFIRISIGGIVLVITYENRIINSAKDAKLVFSVTRTKYNPWGEPINETIITKEEYSAYITLDDSIFWRSKDKSIRSTHAVISEIIDKSADTLSKCNA